jgi:malonate transporter
MELIFKAVFSTFALIFLGFLSERFDVLGENSAKILTNFVYYFALPALLFVGIVNEPFVQIFNLPFIYAFALSAFLVFLLGFWGSKFFKPANIKISTMRALTIASPNTGYMGIPILVVLFGEKAILPVAVSIIILVMTMLAAIFIIEVNNSQERSLFAITKKMLLLFISNPMVIAPLLAIAIAATGWHLPSFINDFAHQIGSASSPCALFAIGQTLVGKRMFAEKIELGFIGFGKLILQPALMLLFIFIFHVSALWAACGFILAALPCATLIYVVAHKYKVYEQRASAYIFETTLISIITLAIAIAIAAYFWPNVLLAS